MERAAPLKFGPDEFGAILLPALDFRSRETPATASALHILDLPPMEICIPATTHHTVAVTLSGVTHLEREADVRRKPEFMQTGDCTIAPIGGTRQWRWDGTVRVAQLYIPQDLFDGCAEHRGAYPDTVALVDTLAARDAFLRQAMVSTLRELRDGLPLAGLYVDSLAHFVAAHLLNRYARTRAPARPNTGGGRLDAVIDLIETDVAANLTLDVLAQCAGMSRAAFLRAFRARTGRSPHQFIIERRLEIAKTLLRKTRLPIADIASAVGFSDQAHFTRRFRQTIGTTPACYRER